MQFKKLSLTALFGAAAAQNTTSNSTSNSLAAALAGNSQLSALNALVGAQPGLLSALGSATNITILAPNNNALSALANANISDPGQIQALLQYHVLNGTYNSSAITNSSTFVRTLLTNTTYTNVTNGQRVEAIKLGNNVTIFSGNFDNSTVVTANVTFSGGIIHVINRVLTIPPRTGQALINADLRALYGALNATGLLTTVAGLKDYTIFAPRNQAFQNIANLVANISTANATSLLTYHVVAGNGTAPYYSTRLSNGTSLQTVNGANLTIHTNSNGTFVNGAKIVTSNVLAAGGVIHVIDNVLNPSNTTFAASQATGAVAFPGAMNGTTVPFTSGVTTRTTTPGGGAASATSAAAASSTSSRAGAVPARATGAVGAAALFGAAGAFAVVF